MYEVGWFLGPSQVLLDSKAQEEVQPYAAQAAVVNAIRTVVDQGMQQAEVMIRGPSLGRDAVLRAIRRSYTKLLPQAHTMEPQTVK